MSRPTTQGATPGTATGAVRSGADAVRPGAGAAGSGARAAGSGAGRRDQTDGGGDQVDAARLVASINSLEVGVLVADGDHRVRLANSALVRLFDLRVDPDQLAGAPLPGRRPAAPPPGPPPEPAAAWAELGLVTGDDTTGTREVRLGDGRVLECTATAITLEGAASGRLWLLRDVTAAAHAREALQEHNERLAALSALKSEFIAIVSHELRTPLTSIATFTEMLSGPGELTSPDAPRAVEVIARNTDRMLVLMQDLTLLAQLETSGRAAPSGAVDLADLVREVGDSIDSGRRVVRVRPDITDGPRISGDEDLLRQLVHAIAGTVACCAAEDEVTLRARVDGGGWTVSATAPTDEFITAEQLLATPLPVLDDASRRRSAALSILLARAIAQSHGGTLTAEVQAAAAATITVRLPLTDPGAPE
ncbi:MAG TPA: histidine kinase dimerization/phospho-acceptor domain-containing protein [Pilimelia sp.]|nr:histidine kinase dimerization/phospho-acceptor domain-containing protein [Pilimelia sp.]